VAGEGGVVVLKNGVKENQWRETGFLQMLRQMKKIAIGMHKETTITGLDFGFNGFMKMITKD
jgi:hypothetical protein